MSKLKKNRIIILVCFMRNKSGKVKFDNLLRRRKRNEKFIIKIYENENIMKISYVYLMFFVCL